MTKLTESAGSYMQKVLDMQEKNICCASHENDSSRKGVYHQHGRQIAILYG